MTGMWVWETERLHVQGPGLTPTWSLLLEHKLYLLRFICISQINLIIFYLIQLLSQNHSFMHMRFVLCLRPGIFPQGVGYTILYWFSCCTKVLLPARVLSLQSVFTHTASSLTGRPVCCHINYCLIPANHRDLRMQQTHTEAKSWISLCACVLVCVCVCVCVVISLGHFLV